MSEEENGWVEWKRHILNELERLNKNFESINDAYNEETKRLWIEISALKTKSGIFGLLGGCLVSIPTLIFFYMRK